MKIFFLMLLVLFGVCFFSSNNETGGKMAAEKLISSGAKHLLLLRGPSFLITSLKKSTLLKSALPPHAVANLQKMTKVILLNQKSVQMPTLLIGMVMVGIKVMLR